MVKLTEDMVAARAKTSDMEMVTKLNFWGSDLTDVSLVSKFKRAVILSFSLNHISTLTDFQYCTALVELYIRRNNIRDLREICYLQDLVHLKRLLMTENPCCESAGDLYRPTVLRALNRLEVLDNQEITPTELEHALQFGLILEHPADRKQKIITPGNKYYEGPDDKPWNPLSHLTTNKQQQRGGTGYDEKFMENDQKDHYHYTTNAMANITNNNNNHNLKNTNAFGRIAESGMDISSFNAQSTNNNKNTERQRPSTATGALHSGHNHFPTTHHEILERINPESASTYRQPPPSQRKCASPLLEFYRNDFCRQSQTIESTRGTTSTTKWSHINNNANNNNNNSNTYDWISTTSNNSIPDQSNTSVMHQQHHHHNQNNSLGPTITIKKSNSNLVSAALCIISELNSHDLDVLENAIRRKQEEFNYTQKIQNKSDQRSSYRLNLN